MGGMRAYWSQHSFSFISRTGGELADSSTKLRNLFFWHFDILPDELDHVLALIDESWHEGGQRIGSVLQVVHSVRTLAEGQYLRLLPRFDQENGTIILMVTVVWS